MDSIYYPFKYIDVISMAMGDKFLVILDKQCFYSSVLKK